jgi:hypothetical protein
MVCFQTKNPNLGLFWRALDWKMFVYILLPFGIFCGDVGYFVTILYSFGTFFPVWVSCTNKNLATLSGTLVSIDKLGAEMKAHLIFIPWRFKACHHWALSTCRVT